MAIFQYEVLNPVVDGEKPHLSKGYFIIPNIGKNYKYFIEAARYTNVTSNREYFLLLSDTKFDSNCRTCRVDDFGRLKLKPKGEFNDILKDITNSIGNIKFEFVESTSLYDVWKIDY